MNQPVNPQDYESLTTPLFIVQILSLILTTWYLAMLFVFLTSPRPSNATSSQALSISDSNPQHTLHGQRKTHQKWPEQTWIYAALLFMAVPLTWNAISSCIANAMLFIQHYGQVGGINRYPYYFKSAPIACGLSTCIVQTAYLNFILRLSYQMLSRPFTLFIGILCGMIIVAELAVVCYVRAETDTLGSYLEPGARELVRKVFDKFTAWQTLNMVADLIITSMMGYLLYRNRRFHGASFNFLRNMTLLIGAGGVVTLASAVTLIVLSQTTSSTSNWIAIFFPLPGSLGAISFLSLLNNRRSWSTQGSSIPVTANVVALDIHTVSMRTPMPQETKLDL